MKTMNRTCLALTSLTVALIAVSPSSASAQTDDLLVRYYMSPGYGGDGMPYRDCSLVGDEEALEEDYSSQPARRDDVVLASGLTPEEAETLRQRRHVELEALIGELDNLLQTIPPDYPNRPDILFRKAEALKDLSDADDLVARAGFSECIDNWYSCASDTECYEPMPDYTDAIEAYRSVARNHPSYARLDEVIFRLGETLMENDNAAEGTQFLTRLVTTYGDSQYIPDARLLMAEHYFEEGLMNTARDNYAEVLNYPDSSIYNYALYKIAWVDINEYQFEDALAGFQTVVRNIDAQGSGELDFRSQALNDMLKCYVELDNGWTMARDYYEGYEGEDLMRRQLSRLSNLYDEQGKDEERIEVLSFFWQRYPTDEMIPQWASDMRNSLEKIGDWDRMEGRVREFISYMRPNTPWAVANQSSERAMVNARGYSHDWLLNIINRNYTEGVRLFRNQPVVARDLFNECETDYADFFAWFPDSSDAYNQAFFYAELLYYKLVHDSDETYPGCSPSHPAGQAQCDEWLMAAGQQYRTVVEMGDGPEAEHAHDSAIGALQVFDDFMKREVPDIDSPLPPPGPEMLEQAEAWLAQYGPELSEAEENYVDIVEWFAELFPEDDLIPAASWRAAGLYLRHNKIAEAAGRFETIIEHHPTHRFAQQAAFGAFVCYDFVEDWVKIERVARLLLEPCTESADQEICEPGRLAAAIAYAMNNQAEDLMTAGSTLRDSGDVLAARAMYVQAAEKRVQLYREFPDSEWSPQALSNAAATYEAARDVDESISLYNEFITRYPDNELVPDAMFTLGLIQDSQARFSTAAEWFERIHNEHPEHETHSDAVLNAARLREALSEIDRSLALYETYIELEPTSPIRNDLYFVMAEMEAGRDNPDAAYARYQSFLDAVSNDPVRRLIAVSHQARIRRDQSRTSDAQALFSQVYNMFGPGEMAFDETNAPTGWVTEPGGNFTGDDRLAVLPYAAEARFMLSEPAYEAARDASLGGWEDLQDNMTARFALMAEAQKELYEVDAFGVASWAIAARSRIGETFYDFYRDLIDLDAPDYDDCLDATRMNYDLCDQAMEQFDEAVFTVSEELRNRAEVVWIEARVAAIRNNVFSPWVTHTITLLNDLDRAYTLGLTEGMTADNAGDPYLSTGYILDLSAKLDAFADFVEVLPDAAGFSIDGTSVDGPVNDVIEDAVEAVTDTVDEGTNTVLDAAPADATGGE